VLLRSLLISFKSAANFQLLSRLYSLFWPNLTHTDFILFLTAAFPTTNLPHFAITMKRLNIDPLNWQMITFALVCRLLNCKKRFICRLWRLSQVVVAMLINFPQ
jgi:hypothetical protein